MIAGVNSNEPETIQEYEVQKERLIHMPKINYENKINKAGSPVFTNPQNKISLKEQLKRMSYENIFKISDPKEDKEK